MIYTTYQYEGDRNLIQALACGDWQSALLSGAEAWDGSTIRNVGWLAEKVARLGEKHNDVCCHVENRLKWTSHLVSRIQQSGLVLRLDGPSARIERAEDEPGVYESAITAGIADLPLVYHRIALAGDNGGIAVYACVASAVYPFGPFTRAERFVLGGLKEAEIGQVPRIDRVHTTLRKALNRTRKLRKKIDDWAAYCLHADAERRAKEEARIEAERAADQARWLAEEGDIIADAFSEAA
jgi:hypothetical protein